MRCRSRRCLTGWRDAVVSASRTKTGGPSRHVGRERYGAGARRPTDHHAAPVESRRRVAAVRLPAERAESRKAVGDFGHVRVRCPVRRRIRRQGRSIHPAQGGTGMSRRSSPSGTGSNSPAFRVTDVEQVAGRGLPAAAYPAGTIIVGGAGAIAHESPDHVLQNRLSQQSRRKFDASRSGMTEAHDRTYAESHVCARSSRKRWTADRAPRVESVAQYPAAILEAHARSRSSARARRLRRRLRSWVHWPPSSPRSPKGSAAGSMMTSTWSGLRPMDQNCNEEQMHGRAPAVIHGCEPLDAELVTKTADVARTAFVEGGRRLLGRNSVCSPAQFGDNSRLPKLAR